MTYSPTEIRDSHGHWTAGGAVHKILGSLGKLKDTKARDALVKGQALDTQKVHKNPDGSYTSSRAEVHKQIVEHFLAQGIARPKGTRPDAIFTAGGPASGKSGLAGRALEKAYNLPVPKGHVYVNPDDIKELLPEYGMLKQQGRGDIAAGATHEESSDIAKVLTRTAMERNMPLVIDGVGDSPAGKFAGKVKAARDAGYNPTVRYAHLPLDIATQREQMRATRSGRKVSETYMKHAHGEVVKRFHQVKRLKGVRVEVYSTQGQGRPRLIAVRDPNRGHGVHVIDRKEYNNHLAKGRD